MPPKHPTLLKNISTSSRCRHHCSLFYTQCYTTYADKIAVNSYSILYVCSKSKCRENQTSKQKWSMSHDDDDDDGVCCYIVH